MDYDLFLRLAAKGETFGYIDSYLACFRRSEDNKTSTHLRAMRREGFAVSKKHGGDRYLRFHVNKCVTRIFFLLRFDAFRRMKKDTLSAVVAAARGAAFMTGSKYRIAMIGLKGIPAKWGGMEKYVEEVGKRLVERGHEVTVFGSRWYCGEDKPRQRVSGMKVRSVPTLHLQPTDALISALLASIIIARENCTRSCTFMVMPPITLSPC